MNIRITIFILLVLIFVGITIDAIAMDDNVKTPDTKGLGYEPTLYELPNNWQLLCLYFKGRMQQPLCFSIHKSWYTPYQMTNYGLQPL